ncbi:4-hydroxy-tetrahydrodipicolinate synthase [bacterium]|nr:4-hydroxy-tetrahydrodipicolinate synthase [bacterium]
MSKTKKIFGCGTAIVTPFTENGDIDIVALKRLVDYQLKEGIDFLVPCGTTGESATLSLEETLLVVETVLQRVEGKIPVIAGAGGYNTAHVIEMARAIERLGVDGLLSVTPYYNKPTQEGLFQHYKALSEAVNTPIIIYNVPPRTNTNILPATVMRLAELDNIIGIKEATGDIGQMSDQAMMYKENFIMLSGDDANALPLIALGGKGLISVAANEIPGQMRQLTHLCLEGEYDKARKLQKSIFPLLRANFIETNPIPVKAALSMMGLIEESYRLPLVPMHPDNKLKLKQVLQNMNLI